MELLTRLWRSSLGKKYFMALSGFALFLFVIGHMLGNLQVFLGPEAINRYGHFLQTTPEILWPARTGLLVLATLHLVTAIRVWLENRAARPLAYAGGYTPLEASYASRTMFVGGVLLGLFIVYHLLHFTVGSANPDFREGDVYHNVIVGFRVWYASAIYIVAMIMLGLHLDHGVWSLCQTLGLQHPRYKTLVRAASRVFALVIVIGNISFPIAVLAGVVKEVAR